MSQSFIFNPDSFHIENTRHRHQEVAGGSCAARATTNSIGRPYNRQYIVGVSLLTRSLSTVAGVVMLVALGCGDSNGIRKSQSSSSSAARVQSPPDSMLDIVVRLSDILSEEGKRSLEEPGSSQIGFDVLRTDEKKAELKRLMDAIAKDVSTLKKAQEGNIASEQETTKAVQGIMATLDNLPRLEGDELAAVLVYLKDDSQLVRAALCRYLQTHANLDALPSILQLLKRDDPMDRRLALVALSPARVQDSGNPWQDLTYTGTRCHSLYCWRWLCTIFHARVSPFACSSSSIACFGGAPKPFPYKVLHALVRQTSCYSASGAAASAAHRRGLGGCVC